MAESAKETTAQLIIWVQRTREFCDWFIISIKLYKAIKRIQFSVALINELDWQHRISESVMDWAWA